MSYPGYPAPQQHYPQPQGYGGYPPPQHQQPPLYGHGTPPPQGYPQQQQQYGHPQQVYQAPAPSYGAAYGGAPPQELPAHHQPSFPPPQSYPSFPPPQSQPSFPPPQSHPSFPPPQSHPSFPAPQHQGTFSAPLPAYTSSAAPVAPPPVLNVASEIFSLHKAMRSFGTDEKTLIRVLSTRDGATIDAIRRGYTHSHGDLIKALQKETSGHFRLALVATALGAGAEGLALWVHKAVVGAGTNEAMLSEALLGRTNAEMVGMKGAYQSAYQRSMEGDVRGDLSLKTKEMFAMVMEGRRSEDWVAADPAQATRDAGALYAATKGRLGTDEITVCRILTRSNDAQIRAIAYEYQRSHGRELQDMIRKEFSGHMRDALLYVVDGAVDKVKRDAELLEAAMKGFGTKDELLVMRVVRCHWNRIYMESVKNRYLTLYGRSLGERIRGETSGHYREMLLALVG